MLSFGGDFLQLYAFPQTRKARPGSASFLPAFQRVFQNSQVCILSPSPAVCACFLYMLTSHPQRLLTTLCSLHRELASLGTVCVPERHVDSWGCLWASCGERDIQGRNPYGSWADLPMESTKNLLWFLYPVRKLDAVLPTAPHPSVASDFWAGWEWSGSSRSNHIPGKAGCSLTSTCFVLWKQT